MKTNPSSTWASWYAGLLLSAVLGLGCSQQAAIHARFVLGIEPGSEPIVAIASASRPSFAPSGSGAETSAPEPDARPLGGNFGGGGISGGVTSTNTAAIHVGATVGFGLFRIAGEISPGSPNVAAVGGMAIDPEGRLFATDPVLNRIIQVDSGVATIAAGDVDGLAGYFGENTLASGSRLDNPTGLVVEPNSGVVIYSDTGNGRIRYFHPGGRVFTLIGGGASLADEELVSLARLVKPTCLATDGGGSLYVVDSGTGKLRRIAKDGYVRSMATLPAGTVSAIAASVTDDRLWLAAGGQILLYHTAAMAPWTAPTVAIERPDVVISGVTFDQDHALYACFSKREPDGLSSATIERIYVEGSGMPTVGKAPERVAGGAAALGPADYLAPASLADARQQPLAGAGVGALAIDLRLAPDPALVGGALVFGSCLVGGAGERWGQILRLEPTL